MLIRDSPPEFFISAPLQPEFKVCFSTFKSAGDSYLLFIFSWGGDVTVLVPFFDGKLGLIKKLLTFVTNMPAFWLILPVFWVLAGLITKFTFLTLLLLPEEVGLDRLCLDWGYCISVQFLN